MDQQWIVYIDPVETPDKTFAKSIFLL